MYLLFLDESGTPDDGIFAVGGVIVRADEWNEIKQRWETCLEDCGWPRENEFKWSETQRVKAAADIADRAYECLTSLPVTCLVTVLYPDNGGPVVRDEFFATPDETYKTALSFIAERYQRFLANADSHGVIVLDSRWLEEDNHMRRYFDRIRSDGTGFANLDRIVDGLLLGPSHFSLGLQLADLVVGPTRTAQFKPGTASRYLRELKPLFWSNPNTGEIDGVGLKIFPKPASEATDRNSPDVRLFNPGQSPG